MTESTSHDVHREVGELLPWWVAGNLDRDESRFVEEHLEECPECRREERRCRREREAVVATADVAPLPHPSRFERLVDGLEESDREGSEEPLSPSPPVRGRMRGMRWALLAQAAVIALLLGILVWQPGISPESGEYRTLSDPAALAVEESRIRLVFDPDVTEGRIRAILSEIDGRIVDGPTRLGAYTVAVPTGPGSDAVSVVLGHLRGLPEVMLAEPVLEPREGRSDER